MFLTALKYESPHCHRYCCFTDFKGQYNGMALQGVAKWSDLGIAFHSIFP